MKDTKQTILDSALRIINARGLSALSIRAVAEDLGLSPGNVSYHFKRKENLVFALAQQLGEGNRRAYAAPIDTVSGLLDLFASMFRRQHAHRGLVLALPDLIETFEDVRAHYRAAEAERRRRIFDMLAGLRDAGALEASDSELWRLVSHITLIARFWIGEARVSYRGHSLDRVIGHYVALIGDTLRGYATADGRAQLAPYAEAWIDASAS